MKRTLSLFSILLIFILELLSTKAFALTAGSYQLLIEPTPTMLVGTTTDLVQTFWETNGNYNSSFSFNQLPGRGSQIMHDVTGDGWAGVIGISVDGAGNVTTTSFQKDDILDTPGATLSQYGTVTGTGSTSGSSLVWDPTGRLGSLSYFPELDGFRWNVDDWGGPNNNNGNTAYDQMTTGSATNGAGTINGTPIYTDSNGDMWATLVSGGTLGSDLSQFWGAVYFEIWKVKIEAVPEPASILLIGTGFAGILVIARRKR